MRPPPDRLERLLDAAAWVLRRVAWAIDETIARRRVERSVR